MAGETYDLLRSLSEEDLYACAWSRGISTYRYTPEQKELVKFLDECAEPVVYIECTRGFRKSSGILNYIVNQCMASQSEALVLSKQQDQISDIIRQQFRIIFDKCPLELMPRPVQSARRYLFRQNKSVLLFDGVDKLGAENKRGLGLNVIFCDEIGSWDKGCYHIIKQVLYPAVARKRQECGRGRIIVATTPSLSSEHDSWRLRDECIAKGAYFRRDIDETPSIYTPSYKKEIVSLYGGEDSAIYQTEFKLKRATNKARAVIPEFDRSIHCVKEYKMPEFCHKYITADWGVNRDFTHILFGYHDFSRSKIVYIKEIVFKNFALIEDIWASYHKTKKELFFDAKIDMEVGDHDSRLVLTFSNKYGVTFLSPVKDNRKEVDINRFRARFKNHQIEIYEPGCPVLIAQCEGGIWKKDRSDYERMTTVDERGEEVSVVGHLDGIDAARYLDRLMELNGHWNSDPKPANYGISIHTHEVRALNVQKPFKAGGRNGIRTVHRKDVARRTR